MKLKPTIEIVPATAADVHPFFHGTPPYRLKAFAGKANGVTIGIGGIYYLPDGTRVAFIDLSDVAKKHPRDVILASRLFLDTLKEQGVRKILAVADPSVPKAKRFLEFFDFKPLTKVKDQIVYQWLAGDRNET